MENGPELNVRSLKVRGIFNQFDRNQDGCLNRNEMANLVIAVNPRVKFSKEQIEAILDEVFRTYGEFIDGNRGLSFEGLLRTYDDGAGDVDRDFDALGLQLPVKQTVEETPPVFVEPRNAEPSPRKSAPSAEPSPSQPRPTSSIANETSGQVGRRMSKVPEWAKASNNGVEYEDTWKLIEDLELLLKRQDTKLEGKRKQREDKKGAGLNGLDSTDWEDSTEQGEGVGVRRGEGELGADFSVFRKELAELRERAGKAHTPDEAFDGHMAMGKSLFERRWHEEALMSFRAAVMLKPQDVRAHFLVGNALYSLGQYKEAWASYQKALEAGEENAQDWEGILPQVHVNLGIALEGEGMLMCACDHYREAAILNPRHYRALKLLGSALFGLGEYRAAQKCLEEALVLKPDYADAHCDLGSALHAVHEDDQAISEFQKAIDLNPNHVDALYNLGGLLKDSGRYERAAEMYSKVLQLRPRDWRAQLNRAVALLGAGDQEEAKKAFKEAFRMTNRLDIYDAIKHLKQNQKSKKNLTTMVANAEQSATGRRTLTHEPSFLQVDRTRFRQANNNTTAREFLDCALNIRRFQKHTRLNSCDINTLSTEIEKSGYLRVDKAGAPPSQNEKVVRKAELEKILPRLLKDLNPETFQSAVRAINERILSVLDRSGSGRVDVGMFFAVLAPLCGGPVEKRKRLVFDILRRRVPSPKEGVAPNADVKHYMKFLRAIYLPTQGTSELAEMHGEDDKVQVSYPEFKGMFDDPNWGFGILNILVKLEQGDRVRHNGVTCAACDYVIIGPLFKETTKKFSLCSTCYSEGKVPAHVKLDEYVFKEYGSEAEATWDRFNFFGSSKQLNTQSQTA
ncbi:hypothetical protein M758_9G149400 [Ceratodon purpureus]|nr:hypothetical protein M758_9G149400 [Ceratodon purpureus]